MNDRSVHTGSSWLARIFRRVASRWLAVLVLVPLMCLGNLGGMRFLFHGCAEHNIHLHAIGPTEVAAHTDHAADHVHQHDRRNDLPAEDALQNGQDPAPSGVIFALVDHDQLLSRGVELSTLYSSSAMSAFAGFVLPTSPGMIHVCDPPDGPPVLRRTGTLALRASDRILRTSRALLL